MGNEAVQTEASRYELATNRFGNPTARIRFTLHNTSDSTLFVPIHCAGQGTRAPALEKRRASGWVLAWELFLIPCVLPEPLRVEPHEFYVDSVTLSEDVFLVDSLDAKGTFRLALGLFYEEAAVTNFTPQTVRYSNEFELAED